MTLPINYQQPMANHSGITINISNPVMNPPGCYTNPQYSQMAHSTYPIQTNPNQYNIEPMVQNNPYPQQGYQIAQPQTNYYNNMYPQPNYQYGNDGYTNNLPQQQSQSMSYPPQYYMNNYNYINTPQNAPINQPTVSDVANPVQNNSENIPSEVTPSLTTNNIPVETNATPDIQTGNNNEAKEADLSLSKELINNLDEQKAAREEAAKNEQKVKVVALTNEYIMSLEDYLNNPNNDIRYTAAKEILTRLDEDRSRHNDAALNALLNKMLQDPDKSIRVAAMSAFASELASGNEYTVKLLKDIQNNPNADKDDVVEAANILLKMSASTEYKYVPMNNENSEEQPQRVE